MHQQKTIKDMASGGLYLIATPIGNLGDMTFRAVEILKTVDYVLAEDTRVSKKLLKHFLIEQEIMSCHEHNQFERTQEIIEDIKDGKHVALISDAGMPCISDPGSVVVQALIEAELPFTIIPGASAGISAYAMSGMSETGKFIFHGFLPTKQQARQAELAVYVESIMPIVFYESPNRIIKTILDMKAVFSPETKIAIFRELTKLHETISWAILEEIDEEMLTNFDTWKGEIVLLVQPIHQEQEWTDMQLIEEIEKLVKQNVRTKDATKQISKKSGVSARLLYQLWEEQKNK